MSIAPVPVINCTTNGNIAIAAQEQCADQRNATHNATQVISCARPGPNARNETTLATQRLGKILLLEDDVRIESR